MNQSIALIGRGGSGKTTLAINLATALAGFGYRTVLAEADLGLPALATHLGAPTPERTINHALAGRAAPQDVLYQHPAGFAVAMSDGSGTGGQALAGTLVRLRDACDVLLIDAPGGVGIESRQAVHAADRAILVASPDRLGMDSARHIMARARPPAPGIILNRWRGDRLQLRPEQFVQALDIPVIGAVPEHEAFREAAHLRWPLVNTHPDSMAAIAVKQLAARLVGQEYAAGTAARNTVHLALRALGVVA
jgi:MinD-like ATPase involved in chromosome partitioning or flagellar assembly